MLGAVPDFSASTDYMFLWRISFLKSGDYVGISLIYLGKLARYFPKRYENICPKTSQRFTAALVMMAESGNNPNVQQLLGIDPLALTTPHNWPALSEFSVEGSLFATWQ